MNGGDAGDGAGLSVWIPGLQVPMSKGQQPPDHGEEHPRAEEGRGEDEEGVLPLQVHHGGEDILQEATLEAAKKTEFRAPRSQYDRPFIEQS